MSAEAQRRYRERHPDRVKATLKAYCLAHPEIGMKRSAKRRETRAQTQPWHSRPHKAAIFAFDANRRAKRQGATGILTATAVRELDGPCAYCGALAMGWDHVIPLCRGGANTVTNLVSCCWPCNERKWRRLPDEAGMWPVRWPR